MEPERIIENLINGNLTAARKAAQRVSCKKLKDCAMEVYGGNHEQADATMWYLKSYITFEHYCMKMRGETVPL